MDQEASVKVFLEHYYATLDANPADLGNLYREGSVLTFEGQMVKGKESIIAKLTSLPFQKGQHSTTTVDCMPSVHPGSVLALVKGNIRLDDRTHALDFTESFLLMPTPEGGFYIFNDVFRTAPVKSPVIDP